MRRAGERAGAAGRRCSREPDAHTPTALALVSYPHFVASDVGTPATRARSQSGCGGRGWRAARPPSPLRGHSIDRPVRAHIDLSSGLSRLWRGKQSERRQAAEADRVGQRPNCWCCLCLCLCLCAPLPCASVGVGVRRARSRAPRGTDRVGKWRAAGVPAGPLVASAAGPYARPRPRERRPATAHRPPGWLLLLPRCDCEVVVVVVVVCVLCLLRPCASCAGRRGEGPAFGRQGQPSAAAQD